MKAFIVAPHVVFRNVFLIPPLGSYWFTSYWRHGWRYVYHIQWWCIWIVNGYTYYKPTTICYSWNARYIWSTNCCQWKGKWTFFMWKHSTVISPLWNCSPNVCLKLRLFLYVCFCYFLLTRCCTSQINWLDKSMRFIIVPLMRMCKLTSYVNFRWRFDQWCMLLWHMTIAWLMAGRLSPFFAKSNKVSKIQWQCC